MASRSSPKPHGDVGGGARTQIQARVLKSGGPRDIKVLTCGLSLPCRQTRGEAARRWHRVQELHQENPVSDLGVWISGREWWRGRGRGARDPKSGVCTLFWETAPGAGNRILTPKGKVTQQTCDRVPERGGGRGAHTLHRPVCSGACEV